MLCNTLCFNDEKTLIMLVNCCGIKKLQDVHFLENQTTPLSFITNSQNTLILKY